MLGKRGFAMNELLEWIAEMIRSEREEYVLALLKKNQKTLHEDVNFYLNDTEIKEGLRRRENYKKRSKEFTVR